MDWDQQRCLQGAVFPPVQDNGQGLTQLSVPDSWLGTDSLIEGHAGRCLWNWV